MSAEKYLEHQLALLTKLTEAVSLDASNWGYTDPRDLGIGDTPPFLPPIPNNAQAFLNRTKRGEYIPAFLTEPQLAWMRRRIRQTVINNEIAINAINQRINYGVGNGMKYEVKKKYPGCPDQVVAFAQTLVDSFVEANNLSQREAEILARMDVDGEAILRVFPRAGGMLHLRFVEPEHCYSPTGDRTSSSFGVETDPCDVENVLGYWLIEGYPDEGATPQLVPASDVWHLKHPETPLNSKRGLSAFFAIEPTLRAAEDLLTSTVFLAKTRAKIAWIHKLTGTTAALAQQLADNKASYTATDPATSESLNIERYRYGSILRIPSTSEIEMPSANIAASDHVSVMQMVLRIIAARFSMPEYLLTADASNGSYASTLVAESPFVKAMERLQGHLSKQLGGNRFGTAKSLIWRQLSHAAECGLLPSPIEQLVDVQVVGPSLVVRDVAKESQVDKTYYELGVKSLQTITMEQGLDFDTEQKNLALEKQMGIGKQPPPPMQPPPGNPPPPPGGDDKQPSPPGSGDQVKESADWDDSKHPRADDGKFGSGGGSSADDDDDEDSEGDEEEDSEDDDGDEDLSDDEVREQPEDKAISDELGLSGNAMGYLTKEYAPSKQPKSEKELSKLVDKLESDYDGKYRLVLEDDKWEVWPTSEADDYFKDATPRLDSDGDWRMMTDEEYEDDKAEAEAEAYRQRVADSPEIDNGTSERLPSLDASVWDGLKRHRDDIPKAEAKAKDILQAENDRLKAEGSRFRLTWTVGSGFMPMYQGEDGKPVIQAWDDEELTWVDQPPSRIQYPLVGDASEWGKNK